MHLSRWLSRLALIHAAHALQDALHLTNEENGDNAVVLNVTGMAGYRPFLGVGYDVLGFDFEQGAQPLVLSTFKKRWADANASWARMVNPTAFWTYNTSRFVADYASLFRDTTNTTLFWTQWAQGQWLPTGSLPDPDNATAVSSWAAARAQFVDSLVTDGQITNLRYYCFSNEEESVPKGNTANFITYNRAVRSAFDQLGGAVAAVKLVGTDFYPCKNSLDGVKHEPSIDSMDCHHYGPEGYDDFKQILAPPLAIAHDANKNFFLSEFGGPSCGGKLASDCHAGPSGAPAGCKDSCAWFDTPTEKKLGLVLAQKVLATINSGGQATGYWTFEDPLGGCPYWGLCRWNTTTDQPAKIGQLRCRSAHYSHGLLSKFLRGPANVYRVHGSADNSTVTTFIRALDGTSTLVILNTAETTLSSVSVQLPPSGLYTRSRFYRYTITEAAPPDNPAGDLPAPLDKDLKASDTGLLVDTNALPARSINIYTSAPALENTNGPERFELLAPDSCEFNPSSGRLQWVAGGEKEMGGLYYRILRGGRQLWSTMETYLRIDPEELLGPQDVGGSFQVMAVDRFGITSAPTFCNLLRGSDDIEH